jgi:hypothetical protein
MRLDGAQRSPKGCCGGHLAAGRILVWRETPGAGDGGFAGSRSRSWRGTSQSFSTHAATQGRRSRLVHTRLHGVAVAPREMLGAAAHERRDAAEVGPPHALELGATEDASERQSRRLPTMVSKDAASRGKVLDGVMVRARRRALRDSPSSRAAEAGLGDDPNTMFGRRRRAASSTSTYTSTSTSSMRYV